ncbi:MAG TPA: DUF5357 family protein [Leptolyngbyaceae cyanobacterium]
MNHFLLQLLKDFANRLQPPKIISWETFVLISIFIWLIASFAKGNTQDGLVYLSWLFLIIGAVWFAVENPLYLAWYSISAWVTGALICIFLFSHFGNSITHIVFVAWPVIAGTINILLYFIKPDKSFVVPAIEVRQKLVILFLSYLLLSCWLQFTFFIQTWLQQYPSLVADNFSQSAFVVKIDLSYQATSRGEAILDYIEIEMRKQIENKSWPQVERWLLNTEQNISKLAKQGLEQPPKVRENNMWSFEAKFLPTQKGYNLQTIAKWRGLGSLPSGYDLKKSCQIIPIIQRPVSRSDSANRDRATLTATVVSQIQCDSVTR